MREKKIAIIIIMSMRQAKHTQSFKSQRAFLWVFIVHFFSTKQSSLMEIIFSCVGYSWQCQCLPSAMKNVQINISTKNTEAEYKRRRSKRI